jgi:phosphoserine phosphatase RsbX
MTLEVRSAPGRCITNDEKVAGLDVSGAAVVMGSSGTTIEWAIAALQADGQRRSGDRHVVRESADGVLLAVIDSLGYGNDVADVAAMAAYAFETARDASLVSRIRRCHQALAGTRGVVAATARIGARGGLSWLSVG